MLVIVRVTDANDSPSFDHSSYPFSVSENASTGDAVGSGILADSHDPDQGADDSGPRCPYCDTPTPTPIPPTPTPSCGMWTPLQTPPAFRPLSWQR